MAARFGAQMSMLFSYFWLPKSRASTVKGLPPKMKVRLWAEEHGYSVEAVVDALGDSAARMVLITSAGPRISELPYNRYSE